MEIDVLKEKFFDFFRKIPRFYYLPIAILVCGLILLSIGMIQLLSSPAKLNENDTLNTSLDQSSTPIVVKQNSLEVDVEGGVVSPGLYSLPSGSRIKDALIVAGGLSDEADRNAVAKQLNLAVKVTDGGKIYIPKIGEIPAAASTGNISSGDNSMNDVLGTTTGLININTASADELESLPGVGQVTAQKIIDGRPYGAVEDMLSRKVVGNSVYQKIKDKVSVY